MYLKQKLEWTKKRRKALDLIEAKLLHMRKLATYVRDNEPAASETEAIDETFQKLKDEVQELDDYSSNSSNKRESRVNASRSIEKLEEMYNK